jgi:hypothetical protein
LKLPTVGKNGRKPGSSRACAGTCH